MLAPRGKTLGIAVLGAALLAPGCGGSGKTPVATSVAKPAPVGHLHTSVVPAGMVDPLRFGYPPSDAVMYPVTGAWAVGDRRSEVDVYAGAASPVQGGAHAGDGLFVIDRYSFLPLHQTQKHVFVQGAGAIRITRAPRGRKVVTSAQRHGVIQFAGAKGVRGTLHLSSDRVTLSRHG